MKKQITGLFAVLMAASSLFISCGNQSDSRTEALEFDSIYVNKTAHLFGDTAKPACNLIISLAYADQANDTLFRDSLNQYLLSFSLEGAYYTLPPKEAVEQYVRDYVHHYRTDLEPMYSKDEQDAAVSHEEVGNWYNYYKGIESHVIHHNDRLLVYRVDFNEYTGGAHGTYGSSFLNLNLQTLMPLRLADLFVEDATEPLTNLLWLHLMADNEVDSREALEEMGFASTGDLTPTENFYLSPNSITFYYNVYDIAPYVMGPTEITLPFDEIEHLLSDNTGILTKVRGI